MKFEILSPYRLRVLMSGEDVEEWALFDEDKCPAQSKNNPIFKKFLRYVNLQTGFDAEKSNVLMEAFPKKGGDVELSITKVDNYSEFRILKELLGYGDDCSCYTYHASDVAAKTPLILEFESLNDFFLLCDAEKTNENFSQSTFYHLNGKYYLCSFIENKAAREDLEILCSEFGHVCSPKFFPRLTEYGELLKENDAVSFFASFA